MKLSKALTPALKQICPVLVGVVIGLAIHHSIFEQPEAEKAEWREESIYRGEEICTFFNRRPINENAYKILFIGNSLTCHPMRGGCGAVFMVWLLLPTKKITSISSWNIFVKKCQVLVSRSLLRQALVLARR